MNILLEIADKRRAAVELRKKDIPLVQVKKRAREAADKEQAGNQGFSFPFEKSLKGEGIHFICEAKKASPSKGVIADSFPYLDIAREYEAAGASAISVLTEPEYFLGKDEYLQKIAREVSVPTLRKDFTVDEYQIYEAKLLGACAVLLICSLLETEQLKDFIQLTHSLGMSALVETHDEAEVEAALKAGARIVGVNNRDLKTFHVDIQTSIRLRKLVPLDRIFVSESGIQTAEDIRTLANNGTNAVLIGEALMRSADKKRMLEELRG